MITQQDKEDFLAARGALANGALLLVAPSAKGLIPPEEKPLHVNDLHLSSPATYGANQDTLYKHLRRLIDNNRPFPWQLGIPEELQDMDRLAEWANEAHRFLFEHALTYQDMNFVWILRRPYPGDWGGLIPL